MGDTTIEWTDTTWNPTLGCTKVSPGCDHCYAETICNRFKGQPAYPNGFGLTLKPHKLLDPLRWRNSRRVFVNSMSDLFHPKVPDDYIDRVFETMRMANWHTYQVLTKRPKRMRRWSETRHPGGPGLLHPLDHVWLGASVEDRRHGLPRIDDLRKTPAAVRFLSIEPLLEDLGWLDLQGIDWVIVGGESGPGARPMEFDWVANVHLQCIEARVPFFFKQWGGVRKKEAGRELVGKTWDAMPVQQHAEHPGRAEVKRRLELLQAPGESE